MKYFIITISLFSQFSFANDTIDIQNMLQSSRCIPHRAEDGTVTTFKCDGPMGELMKIKKMEFQPGSIIRGKPSRLNKSYKFSKFDETYCRRNFALYF